MATFFYLVYVPLIFTGAAIVAEIMDLFIW